MAKSAGHRIDFNFQVSSQIQLHITGTALEIAAFFSFSMHNSISIQSHVISQHHRWQNWISKSFTKSEGFLKTSMIHLHIHCLLLIILIQSCQSCMLRIFTCKKSGTYIINAFSFKFEFLLSNLVLNEVGELSCSCLRDPQPSTIQDFNSETFEYQHPK